MEQSIYICLHRVNVETGLFYGSETWKLMEGNERLETTKMDAIKRQSGTKWIA